MNYDESMLFDAFALHADNAVVSRIRSKHALAWNGHGKLRTFKRQYMPGLSPLLDWIITCSLTNKCTRVAKSKLKCSIAFSMPLVTSRPELRFSTLCRVQRNKLLDISLNSLLNVSINRSTELSDEDSLMVTKKWTTKENRK